MTWPLLGQTQGCGLTDAEWTQLAVTTVSTVASTISSLVISQAVNLLLNVPESPFGSLSRFL